MTITDRQSVDIDLPGGRGAAYIAGQARACPAVKRHLVRKRGWSGDQIVVEPFWTPGRRGMD